MSDSQKCELCEHDKVCGVAMCGDPYFGEGCNHYEPKRVKCGNGVCMVGIADRSNGVSTVCEFMDKTNLKFIWEFEFCPKCGHRIDVK